MPEILTPPPDFEAPDLPGEPINLGPYTKKGDNVVRWYEEGEKQAILLPDNEKLVSGPYGVNGEDREPFIVQNNPETGEVQAHMHFMDYVDANEGANGGVEARQIEEASDGKAINGATLARVTTDKDSGAKVLQAYNMNTRDQATLELPPEADLYLVDNDQNGMLDQMITMDTANGRESVLLSEYLEQTRQAEAAKLNLQFEVTSHIDQDGRAVIEFEDPSSGEQKSIRMGENVRHHVLENEDGTLEHAVVKYDGEGNQVDSISVEEYIERWERMHGEVSPQMGAAVLSSAVEAGPVAEARPITSSEQVVDNAESTEESLSELQNGLADLQARFRQKVMYGGHETAALFGRDVEITDTEADTIRELIDRMRQHVDDSSEVTNETIETVNNALKVRGVALDQESRIIIDNSVEGVTVVESPGETNEKNVLVNQDTMNILMLNSLVVQLEHDLDRRNQPYRQDESDDRNELHGVTAKLFADDIEKALKYTSVVEAKSPSQPEKAPLRREALDDIRLLIDSLDMMNGDVQVFSFDAQPTPEDQAKMDSLQQVARRLGLSMGEFRTDKRMGRLAKVETHRPEAMPPNPTLDSNGNWTIEGQKITDAQADGIFASRYLAEMNTDAYGDRNMVIGGLDKILVNGSFSLDNIADYSSDDPKNARGLVHLLRQAERLMGNNNEPFVLAQLTDEGKMIFSLSDTLNGSESIKTILLKDFSIERVKRLFNLG